MSRQRAHKPTVRRLSESDYEALIVAQIIESAEEDRAAGLRPTVDDCPYGLRSEAGKLWLAVINGTINKRGCTSEETQPRLFM